MRDLRGLLYPVCLKLFEGKRCRFVGRAFFLNLGGLGAGKEASDGA